MNLTCRNLMKKIFFYMQYNIKYKLYKEWSTLFKMLERALSNWKAGSPLLDDFAECKTSILGMLKGQDSYILQLLSLKKSILQIEITI